MATPKVKDLVLHSPAGSTEVVTFGWPLQIGTGQDKHDNGIDIIDTIKFVCEELPSISSAFEETNFNQINTACYETMSNLVERFNKAVDSLVALEKGTSLPTERLNKYAHPNLLKHILQLVYNAAVLDPDKLNNYEPFSPEVYGETSYELVQQMIKHISINNDDTFVDLGSGVGQVVLQMAGSFPLKACLGIEKADTPAYYAERMDTIFRQYMAWFGKRYCEYKLIKGDFLIDEHREKITSSTLVFVNNFAFGPTVDHQLKERFADLRDGARVVSSKSFCPLNFRITDRNLSDIGTIMHVSEIPPEKGSVSWTCKPVSYYLHTIDRTKLEQYFQRLKTQKGSENDHTGSTRTTRDRAKREANIGVLQNPLSTNITNRTNSPANLNNTNTNKNKQQITQQRNIDLETSTESDGDILTNANLSSTGPMTRKVWSDWCSSKDKSSQSEEEENINTNTRIIRNTRTIQKKRKKLTRKAAIVSKNTTAAQRVAAARQAREQRESGKNINLTDATKEGNATVNNSNKGGRKGRLGKRTRGRKSINIIGLDLLHEHTLVNTSIEALCKKMPPAPGIIDHQLTSLLTGNMSHTELDIPEAPQDTPYALQILLDLFRSQYMSMIEHMKSESFVSTIKKLIKQEKDRRQRLKNRTNQLDKQIKVLIDDSVALLKIRMNELGINVNSPNDLIAKAKEIVGRHKELQGIAIRIQTQVTKNEMEQSILLKNQLQHLPEYQQILLNNNMTKLEEGHELSEKTAQELVLKEIANTLAHRKKLYAQVSNIEKETSMLEKSINERKTAAVLLPYGTHIIPNDNSMTISNNRELTSVMSTSMLNAQSTTQQKLHTPYPAHATNSLANVPQKGSASSRNNRRNRENAVRIQEWPDVPDVGKIEESNPEVLAQKILETGRQIEAGKLTVGANAKQIASHEDKRVHKCNRQVSSNTDHGDSSCANFLSNQQHSGSVNTNLIKNQQNLINVSMYTNLPICEVKSGQKSAINCGVVVHESPKVANFEDRLKSIITSALNEDQEHRKSSTTQHMPTTREELSNSHQKLILKRNTSSTQQKASVLSSQSSTNHNQNNLKTGAQNSANFNSTMVSKISPPPTVPSDKNVNVAAQYAKITSSDHDPNAATLITPYRKYNTADMQTNSKFQYSSDLQEEHTAQHVRALAANQLKFAYLTNKHTGNKEAIPADLTANNRHNELSGNEMFVVQHKPQLQNAVIESSNTMNSYGFATVHAASTPSASQNFLEFKTPNMSSELCSQRCSSRDIVTLEDMPPRSGSASSDSAVTYFLPTRDRQATLESNVCRESAGFHVQQNQFVAYPNRPSSNSSQPDYTQVSPAKIALRRHLSQEKLNQLSSNSNAVSPGALPLSTKTIGDLVNGEIERTLEISHQSIINAAVNMSTVGASLNPGCNYMDAHIFAERERNRMNKQASFSKISRSERVHIPDDITERLNVSTNAKSGHPNLHNFPIDANSSNYQKTVSIIYSGNSKPIKTDDQLSSVSSNNKVCSPVTSPQSKLSYKNVSSEEYLLSAHHQLPPNLSKNLIGNQNVVSLPRAEMKGCIEAYFSVEDQQRQHQQQLNHKQNIQYHTTNYVKERSNVRNPRGNNGNPPLEGLAASLQSHLLNARKQEERQRRAGAVSASLINICNSNSTKPDNCEATETNDQARGNCYQPADCSSQSYSEDRVVKREIGNKRNSPSALTKDQPRPNKLAHYVHEATVRPQQSTKSHYSSNGHNTAKSTGPYSNKNNGIKSFILSPPTSYYTSDQRKPTIDHILTSPEGNATMSDEYLQKLSSSATTATHSQFEMLPNQSSCNNPTVNAISGRVSGSGTAVDDDDGVADDEIHWKHCVSSGFDRLIAFASTALDKTRRSIDVDVAPSAFNSNTSTDAETKRCSHKTDATSHFLATTTSTQPQETLFIKTHNSILSGNNVNNKNQNHMICKSAKIINTDVTSCIDKFKMEAANVDLSDNSILKDSGMPRTPSPMASVIDASLSTIRETPDGLKSIATNNLKIPLKYQRKSKSLEKHYKKKFCERNWEYDCDDIVNTSNTVALTQSESALHENSVHFSSPSVQYNPSAVAEFGNETDREKNLTSASQSSTVTSHHKSSKFRPKGKDWDWSLDSNNCLVKNRIDNSSNSFAKATPSNIN